MNVQCFASRAPQSCLCIKAAHARNSRSPDGHSHEQDSERQISDRPSGAASAVSVSAALVFDIDPIFSNTEEWYESIPAEVRPHKDQPFYHHLFAENDETEYIAYVSEQNLLPDNSGEPVRHPQVAEVFVQDGNGVYRPRQSTTH